MAANTFLIRFTYENGVSFKMETKQDDAPVIIPLELQEDGHLNELWDRYQAICEQVIKTKLIDIGKVMKQP